MFGCVFIGTDFGMFIFALHFYALAGIWFGDFLLRHLDAGGITKIFKIKCGVFERSSIRFGRNWRIYSTSQLFSLLLHS